MSNETDTQEARGEQWLRDNPRCEHCERRHGRQDPSCRPPYVVRYVMGSRVVTGAPPRVIIEVEGGLVARVLSDVPVDVTIVDCDVEGCGEEEDGVMRVAPGSRPNEYDLAQVSQWEAESNAAEVAAYLKRIEEAQR